MMSTRTTLSLDPDVAALLEQEMRETGASLKYTVNAALRRALRKRAPASERRFVVRARPLRARPGFDFDHIAELIEQAEGPGRR
jgi:hypothetical protein